MAGSSWGFSDIVSSLKEKSSSVITTLSNDLQEFSTILREDIAEVTHQIEASAFTTSEEGAASSSAAESETPANNVHENSSVQQSLFAFGSKLESLSSQWLQSAGDFITGGISEGREPEDDESASARRYRLLGIQEDPATYISVPEDIGTFRNWKAALDPEKHRENQERLLREDITVSKMYEELVPSSVDRDSFWNHYFYKVSLLEAEENLRSILFHHGEDEEAIGWDADDDEGEGDPTEQGDIPQETTTASSCEAEPSTAPELVTSPIHKPASSEDSWIDVDDSNACSAQTVLPNEVSATLKPEKSSGENDNWDGDDGITIAPVATKTETKDDDWGDEVDSSVPQAENVDLKMDDDWGDDEVAVEATVSTATTVQTVEPKVATRVKTESDDNWGEWD